MRTTSALLLCVLLVGCSPSSSNDSATTIVTVVSTTAAVTTTTTLSPAAARLAFVSCLADEGVEVPADAFDADGAPRLGALAESLNTADPAVQEAVVECSPLLTSSQAVDLMADPEVRNLVIEQLAAFAQCMRDQGLADFPDPDVDAPVDAPFAVEDVPFSSPGFDEALGSCRMVVGSFGLGGA
ncbi:MAG: hypothetical protein WD990_10670 [Acidimicrobiia bacterium]